MRKNFDFRKKLKCRKCKGKIIAGEEYIKKYGNICKYCLPKNKKNISHFDNRRIIGCYPGGKGYGAKDDVNPSSGVGGYD